MLRQKFPSQQYVIDELELAGHDLVAIEATADVAAEMYGMDRDRLLGQLQRLALNGRRIAAGLDFCDPPDDANL